MPTYQYACTECGHQLEAVQSFSDAALTECPNCNGKLRKVFNSVGIVFKGSGFYRNDSRAGAVSPEKSGTANGETTKSEPSTSPAKTDSSSSTPAKSPSTSSSSSSTSSSTTSSSGTAKAAAGS